MLFYNDNAIHCSLKSRRLFDIYQPEMAVSQASRVVQIVSHDLFKAFSFALQTQFAVIMLNFPEKTGLRKHKALPLMASLFSCLQGSLAGIIFDGTGTNDHSEMASYIWSGTCEITRHKSY